MGEKTKRDKMGNGPPKKKCPLKKLGVLKNSCLMCQLYVGFFHSRHRWLYGVFFLSYVGPIFVLSDKSNLTWHDLMWLNSEQLCNRGLKNSQLSHYFGYIIVKSEISPCANCLSRKIFKKKKLFLARTSFIFCLCRTSAGIKVCFSGRWIFYEYSKKTLLKYTLGKPGKY